MNDKLSRRHAIRVTATAAILSVVAGCGGSTSVHPAIRKAGRVVIAVAKKLFKIGNVAIDLAELAVEIKAIIDGKEETIVAHITKEEADSEFRKRVHPDQFTIVSAGSFSQSSGGRGDGVTG